LNGEILLAENNYDEAAEVFDKLVKEDPQSALAHYFKAVSYIGKNETGSAKTALLRAVELDPKLLRAKLLLASIYLQEQAYDLAEKESREVLQMSPGIFQAHLIFGNACMYQQKKEAAKNAFETLIKLEPENPVGYYRLGILNQALKQTSLARANFEKALELNPMLMDVFAAFVKTEVLSGNADAALAHCDRQLGQVGDASVHAAVIHSLKGDIYMSQKNFPAAEESFNVALAQDSNYLKPYFELARIYLTQNQQEKAIAQYKALLEKNPQQPGAQMLLGTLYEAQGKPDLAEAHYRKALEITPDFAPAANNLAYVLVTRNKNIDEALKFAQVAKRKLPNDPSVADTLGWVYYHKGLYDNAVRELRDSAAQIPNNPEVHYHLGMAYFKKEEKELARASLETALSLKPDFNGAKEARKALSDL
jgi:tetratricopeptide (TPR) repeat protein